MAQIVMSELREKLIYHCINGCDYDLCEICCVDDRKEQVWQELGADIEQEVVIHDIQEDTESKEILMLRG